MEFQTEASLSQLYIWLQRLNYLSMGIWGKGMTNLSLFNLMHIKTAGFQKNEGA